MTPSDLARWESSAGPGYDAAGRLVYSGPGMMYMGPGDKSATQAVHQGLMNDANMVDGGSLIRALLAERNRNAARNMGVNPAPWLELKSGGGSFTYAPNSPLQK
jgi:hypothetical protein